MRNNGDMASVRNPIIWVSIVKLAVLIAIYLYIDLWWGILLDIKRYIAARFEDEPRELDFNELLS